MVTKPNTFAYQLQGDVGSLSGSADLCKELEGSPCTVESRQHHNCVLHKPNGRLSLSIDDGAYPQNLELELGEENLPFSRALTRETEPDSRSGIQNGGRQLRMETSTSSVSLTYGTTAWGHAK